MVILQKKFHRLTFAAVTILIVASGVIHQRRKGRLSVREYVKTLFLGKTVNQKRIVYMDYLRILATVLVIAVHVMEPAYQQMLLLFPLSLAKILPGVHPDPQKSCPGSGFPGPEFFCETADQYSPDHI